MKTFKKIDIIISIALILLFTCYAFINEETFFIGYFAVGGWQVFSMIIHWATGTFTERSNSRWLYQRAVAILFSIFIVCWLFYMANSGVAIVGIYLLMLMLVVSPLMAIGYTVMCYHEYRALKHRQLIQLRN